MKSKIIFFGNGPLAEYALAVLERECEVIFHAREKGDLAKAVELKQATPEAHGVLASFGVMIGSSVLEAFEPEGILNIHPSLLPLYRGASPIESALLAGDTEFGVSVMKLVRAMDAGPIYWQESFAGLPLSSKDEIYRALATAGAEWIVAHLGHLPEPVAQDEARATYTRKFEKKDGILELLQGSREEILRKIVAFQGFPKPKFTFWGTRCTILAAHVPEVGETAVLTIECTDGPLAIDSLQPEGRKIMDARSFVNGYKK